MTMGEPGHPVDTVPLRPHWLGTLLERLRPPDNVFLMVLAVVVGMFSGLAAVLFHWLIEGTHIVFFEWFAHMGALQDERWWFLQVMLPPMLGGLLAGSITWLLARHDTSHGTSSVMEAVALHGGRLATLPYLAKSLAAGLLIGAGGSAGPEDPSVQIGAVMGSHTIRALRPRASEKQVRTVVTAGVAGAIAAIFNAPISGVFFALEVIAGDFSAALFAPVVLASVVGSIVGRALIGTDAAFPAPTYELVNPLIETPLYGLLGMLIAVVGVGFIRLVFRGESLFEKIGLPGPLCAALGGGMVGLIALALPPMLGLPPQAVLNVGYETANDILHDTGPTGLVLLGLFAAKLLATIITLGTARVGGTFAPALVLGGMAGSLFGQAVNAVLPGMTAPPAAYALVGMGAMLNAVVRAPITSVLLLFEVTGDYAIILAIMASVVTSQLIAHWLHPESIYTERLARKGIQLRFGRDVNLLELVTVGEVMTPDFTTVPHTMSLQRLRALFDRTRHHGFPVLDDTSKLVGIVTLTDLRRGTQLGLNASAASVDDIATRQLLVLYPDQSLNTALRAFARADVGRIPIVERGDHSRLLGVLRRRDVFKAYEQGAMRRDEMERRRQQMRLSSSRGSQVLEVLIRPDSGSDGRLVRDLGLPQDAIITSIHRSSQVILPRGDTLIHAHDRLTLLVQPEQIPEVESRLLAEGEQSSQPRYHELVLPPGAAAVGRAVAALGLPPKVLIVTLRRGGQVQAVHGETVLKAGDEIIFLAAPVEVEAVWQCLNGEGP